MRGRGQERGVGPRRGLSGLIVLLVSILGPITLTFRLYYYLYLRSIIWIFSSYLENCHDGFSSGQNNCYIFNRICSYNDILEILFGEVISRFNGEVKVNRMR